MKLLSWLLKFAVMAVCMFALALLFARAYEIEDKARVAKLERHFYEVALNRAPAPPQNVRPNHGDLAEPKTAERRGK